MNLKIFLELVEIKAKTASIFPFLLAALYSYYRFGYLNFTNMLIFFVAMLLFNMAVDANDNYQDYKRAKRNKTNDFISKTNVIGVNHLNIHMIGWLVFALIFVSALLGIWLTIRTNWIILVMGLFCFAVGYLYAGGPWPLSSLPIAEFFAGFTMGYMIFLINVFLNLYSKMTFNWSIAIEALLPAGLISFAISALLLANNICDEEEDKTLKRHTIVYYLGRSKSLILYDSFYVIGFLLLLFSVILKLQPIASLLTFAIVPLIWHNLVIFHKKQVKKETFILSIKNLLFISVAQTLTVAIGVFLHF
ncbi:1,4-dihydroxy-2-naphthoate polyprenyltransferase [Oenococcus oeni]|uniref:1,4-dihydroxy-2-naphthoate octaprenyltransferase n=9 Tax=Oenococcus oeni TaxID=1247 RepID=Q04D03_OENOB|nr:1,4-dihydroxy-2-naphthoate polyprenyltransferase [Oenococcus oeni]EAV38860.1 prenyltransferase, UbiA family [Oenococcus oeni ATCC BAA-1163]ABJ57669.1 1,4-dihydroxy-2-naphthoate octaprenyltransferase [Oenococcus oeni PSU-1]AVI94964.1 1,4-dihydroxy-2-naphthoate prenyltransferase [Oenococcus oeni]AWW98814.1 prenyltransferase [Oenococcus oeni]EFD87547.1 hypothetical protein AWRIB429_1889 [Oenococcus oeni AWRIB429]